MGGTESFGAGGEDVYLIKTDARGNVLWTKTYGGPGQDRGYSIELTAVDREFVIAGYTSSFGAGSFDVYLIRTDTLGSPLWPPKTYGGPSWDEGRSVRQTEDGGYVIVGTTNFATGMDDIYLIRTDPSGNVLWTKTYGGPLRDWGYSVWQTGDLGFAIVGATEVTPNNMDVFLIKTDRSGKVLWTRTYGGPREDVGYSVQQTEDGGLIIAGTTASFGAGANDVYLIKTDRLGNLQWQRTYGGPGNDVGLSVRQTSDGGYIIAGWTTSFGAGMEDVYLIRTDALGNPLWTRTCGGPLRDYGYSVQQTEDLGFVVVGATEVSVNNFDVYLIKTDRLGRC